MPPPRCRRRAATRGSYHRCGTRRSARPPVPNMLASAKSCVSPINMPVVRVAIHPDVRNRTTARRRRDAGGGLIPGLLEQRLAEDLVHEVFVHVATAGPVLERNRVRPGGAVACQRPLRGSPAGLERPVARAVDRERGSTDRGDPGILRRPVGMEDTPELEIVSVVTGREVEPDAFKSSLLEDRLVGGDEVRVDRRSSRRRRSSTNVGEPHELDTIDAASSFTICASDASRSSSKQLAAP